jgi:hypothetical protein
MQRAGRWAIFVSSGILLFLLIAWLIDRLGSTQFIGSLASDFHEFYCAGNSVLLRGDPYLVEPLGSCMRRLAPNSEGWYATPAPLPGYALAMFAAFARLPFPVSQLLWEMALVACTLLAALALAELTGWSALFTTLSLIPTVGLLNLVYGELTPVVVAALSCGALALERGYPRVAALGVCGAMIEPHIGLPALVALIVLVPAARLWAFYMAAVIGIISIVTIGLAANLEYFRSVLPLQAFAEVVANDQYSLTHLLASLGVSTSMALWLGSASYVVMAVVGIALAARLWRRRPAYALLLPPAAVTLGGSFIHDVQIATAIPVALLLAADVPAARTWAIGAVMLLVVRIRFSGVMAYVSITSLLAIAALGWVLLARKPLIWRTLAVATSLIAVGLGYVVLSAFPHSTLHDTARISATTLPLVTADENASAAWAAYVRARPDMSTSSARYIVEKLPAWIGLLIILGCALNATRLKPAERDEPVKVSAEKSSPQAL